MTTITREKINELAGGGLTDAQMDNIAAYFGITIAPPDPPADMVKLAREIVDACADEQNGWQSHVGVALAALQYADKVVREAPDFVLSGALLTHIRRALGAIA